MHLCMYACMSTYIYIYKHMYDYRCLVITVVRSYDPFAPTLGEWLGPVKVPQNPVSRQNMMGPSTGVMGVCKLGEGTFLNPRPYMSYTLNSLKGSYIGDYIGNYYRGY